MYKHTKIAITGGPCAGKTTAMQKIVQEFTEKGYKVFVVNETATDLINGGIKPFGDAPIDIVEFQRCVLDMQLSKEALYEKIANGYNQDTIILCDRGVFDNRAYITNEQFKELLKERKLNEMELMSSYDMVIHLVTAADGAEDAYTTANNSARTETPSQARDADRRTLNSWIGHKRLEIITNESTFDDKIHNVVKSIYEFLGKPYPIQKQHKFLVDKINLAGLRDKHLVKLELEQFFTDASDTENTMVRKTTKDGESSYSRTVKKDTEVVSERITTSRRISEREYNELLKCNLDHPIRKCRYCFTYQNQYYKLDVFEEPKGLAILETELTNKSKEVVIPDFISVKKDITEDLDYRNINLYRKVNGKRKNSSLVKKAK
ncbi:MAG: AAA family ATPase [Bacilli bacterium]|nr:AAA family ATPase [Bacilli bacterium]